MGRIVNHQMGCSNAFNVSPNVITNLTLLSLVSSQQLLLLPHYILADLPPMGWDLTLIMTLKQMEVSRI